MHGEVFKNTFFQIISKVVTSGTGFLITIFLARQFGASGFGDFTKIVTFVSFFYLAIDFGLNAIFLQKENSQKLFREFFYLRLFLALVFFLLANGIAFFLPFDASINSGFSPSVRLGIFIYSLSFFTQAVLFSTTALFQKKLRYDFLMVAITAGSLANLILIFIFTIQGKPLSYDLFALVLGGVVASLVALFAAREKLIPIQLELKASKDLLAESLPIGLMLLFNLIYFRVDLFILSFFKPTTDVGIYGLAYRFFDFLISLPLFLSNSLYPFLLSARKNSRSFFSLTKTYLWVFVLAGLVMIIPFWFLTPALTLIKEEFVKAIVPFRILLVSLPIFFATSFLQWVLISQKQQRYLLILYMGSMIFNIVLNLLFIPRFSYIASAVITGVSEGLILIFLLIKVASVRNFLKRGYETN